jgi:5'-methylthioinosine phosphorylase
MPLAIIGGSGCRGLVPDTAVPAPGSAEATPFGEPSGPLWRWPVGHELRFFQHRHGDPHRWLPHEINYRANLWQLRRAGATAVLGLNTVGAIDPALRPGSLVSPDQLIDYTWGRAASFAGHPDVAQPHVEFTTPFAAGLRARLAAAASEADLDLTAGGVYGVTQGPRLETAAEIDRLARDGCTVVGMTAMPEAVLARELGLPYALLCLVVNPAAGRGHPGDPIHAAMPEATAAAVAKAGRLLAAWAAAG